MTAAIALAESTSDERKATNKRGAGAPARVLELLLVGGITLVLFPLSWIVRRIVGLDSSEFAIGFLTFYGAFVINDPHFSVTYLLFYKDARRRALGSEYGTTQRARYWIAGAVVPIALSLWAIFALKYEAAQSLGWMIELMFLLVGWHYAKQGFGVLTVLSARRGVKLTARERLVFLAHCYAAWAFAWANPTTPSRELEEKGVVWMGIAHPRWLEIGCGAVLGVSTLALAITLIQRWKRGELRPILSLVGVFLITIWSWTIWMSIDPLVRYVIPALHSIQYLYFVWLMKRNEARAEEGPPSFGRPVAVRVGLLVLSALALGWLFFHGAPEFLDTAFVARKHGVAINESMGDTPYFAALYVVVNIHHYFMDWVIWRRDNPDTRYLAF